MKSIQLLALLALTSALILHPSALAAAAPLGTTFTYQGRLASGSATPTGLYDFQFSLWDAASGGAQTGSTLDRAATSVTNGLFTVTLDFGSVFDGNARWLAIWVRTNGAASFTALTPRQAITASPYALFAPNAGVAASAATANSVGNNAVTGAGIASGQVVKSLNGLKDTVALAAGPNVSLATNANTLTISAAGGGASGGWSTTGNAGTTPAANFIGTTDGQPLVLKANNVGINTNNPQAALHVNGTVLATRFSGDGSGLVNVPATLSAPFTITNLAVTNNGGYPSALAISGRYAYVVHGYAGLHVYDVADPAHPLHVGQDTDFGWDATAVAISGHYAFVASDTLYTVDVSSPTSPMTVGAAPALDRCYGVAVSGNIAYLAAGDDGLFTYNVAEPTLPVVLGHIDNGGSAKAVAVSGNFAYLANDADGLRIYNVANPAAPVNISRRSDGGRALGIAEVGNFAYLANADDGLRIYNIANPTNPAPVSHIPELLSAHAVAVSGSYAYVANYGDGVWVYDVSDPAHPARVGVAPIPTDDGFASGVAVSGNYAFSANGIGGFATYYATSLVTVPGLMGASGFLGDGSGLTNLNAAQLSGQLSPSLLANAWKTGGNAGTAPGQNFLGTTDNQPLELRANGNPVMRLEPSGNVGIGTLNPASALDVNGALRAFSFVGATNLTMAGCTNTGVNSVALGTNTTASRFYSFATGWGAKATGDWCSTAMGYETTASGRFSTALGYRNIASGEASTAMGYGNTASATASTAMGMLCVSSDTYALAAGFRAKALHHGTFVWADGADVDFPSTSYAQFLIRASGGVGINTNNPQSALHVVGTVTATAFNPPSDRNLKENFKAVNPSVVLAKVVGMPISEWNFKGDAATPHIGPMAQDFHGAFGVGTDDKHIATVDADGVALAAIQGLNLKLSEELKRRDAENAELRKRLERLESILARQTGGGQ